MRSILPPHIAWPGLVVLILSIGITAVGITIHQAHKDGGVAMVDDYTVNTSDWEELTAARGETRGWTGSLAFNEDEPSHLQLELADAQGHPVSIGNGTLTLRQPHHEVPFYETPLQEEAPGEYAHTVPLLKSGVWDAVVRGTVDETRVEYTVRFTHGE